jgi:alpha-tubulin suppressor-like RCC1 family protein
VSAGYQFNCTVNAGGALSCWGSGEEGQLATTDVDHCGPLLPRCTPDPKPAATTLTFASISAGNAFACGVTPASTIACWGRNSEQQLGVGGFTPSSAPLPLDATGFWGSVSTGYFHACALQTDGTPYCWGLNNNAQLGDGSTALTQGRPQPVTGGRVFTQIVAGSDHTCALAFNGAAWCWGNNQVGQVGVN